MTPLLSPSNPSSSLVWEDLKPKVSISSPPFQAKKRVEILFFPSFL